ncbi:MAG: hypothetical protein JWP97_1882 [Labilithrix sp.]|nr:hypothetical protein [Labilithrix sp.]
MTDHDSALRVLRIAELVAEAADLAPREVPGPASRQIGAVRLELACVPRRGRVDVVVELTYPDVQLGIVFRKKGILDSFRESPLLPADLVDHHLEVAHQGRTVKAFVDAALRVLGGAEDLRFSDDHLTLRFTVDDADEGRSWVIATAAVERARALDAALARLPFQDLARRAEHLWRAAAEGERAILVPTGPSLHGLRLRARAAAGGEEHEARVSIRSARARDELDLHDEVLLDLAPLTLGERARLALAAALRDEAALTAVRDTFRTVRVAEGGGAIVLERAAWSEDPRALLPAVEALFAWIVEMSAERGLDHDAPYR